VRYPDLAYQVRGGKLKFDHALAEARARAKALPEPPSPRKVARPPGRCRGYTTSFFFTPLGNRAKREAVSQLVVGHLAADRGGSFGPDFDGLRVGSGSHCRCPVPTMVVRAGVSSNPRGVVSPCDLTFI